MTGLGIYLSNNFRQTQIDRLEKEMTSEAIAISYTLSSQMDYWVHDEILSEQVAHWANLLGARLTLIFSDGTVLVDSHEDPSQMDNHLNRPEIQEALQNSIGNSVRFSQTMGFDMMYIAVPVFYNN